MSELLNPSDKKSMLLMNRIELLEEIGRNETTVSLPLTTNPKPIQVFNSINNALSKDENAHLHDYDGGNRIMEITDPANSHSNIYKGYLRVLVWQGGNDYTGDINKLSHEQNGAGESMQFLLNMFRREKFIQTITAMGVLGSTKSVLPEYQAIDEDLYKQMLEDYEKSVSQEDLEFFGFKDKDEAIDFCDREMPELLATQPFKTAQEFVLMFLNRLDDKNHQIDRKLQSDNPTERRMAQVVRDVANKTSRTWIMNFLMLNRAMMSHNQEERSVILARLGLPELPEAIWTDIGINKDIGGIMNIEYLKFILKLKDGQIAFMNKSYLTIN